MDIKSFFYGLWKKIFPSSFFEKDGTPLRCHACGSKDFTETVTDMLDGYCGPVTESYTSCSTCGIFVQEWAYGYYNPATMQPEPWIYILKRLEKQRG